MYCYPPTSDSIIYSASSTPTASHDSLYLVPHRAPPSSLLCRRIVYGFRFHSINPSTPFPACATSTVEEGQPGPVYTTRRRRPRPKMHPACDLRAGVFCMRLVAAVLNMRETKTDGRGRPRPNELNDKKQRLLVTTTATDTPTSLSTLILTSFTSLHLPRPFLALLASLFPSPSSSLALRAADLPCLPIPSIFFFCSCLPFFVQSCRRSDRCCCSRCCVVVVLHAPNRLAKHAARRSRLPCLA
ncbi:hypothetical protein B0H16DRAFT_1033761 [Mycena metata]|uniref:Uncharacterized protein n=1 Tax=Mycena metata TaxID=1033252 RepID=A0AAD7IEL4_9AGAR|nr:hypothetical protein B0H16DRAFT_1033761 [Mycena metata]